MMQGSKLLPLLFSRQMFNQSLHSIVYQLNFRQNLLRQRLILFAGGTNINNVYSFCLLVVPTSTMFSSKTMAFISSLSQSNFMINT
jgi:hypothetical protein